MPAYVFLVSACTFGTLTRGGTEALTMTVLALAYGVWMHIEDENGA